MKDNLIAIFGNFVMLLGLVLSRFHRRASIEKAR